MSSAQAPSDWWKTFFAGPTVSWWLGAVPEAATIADADFVESCLGVRPGAKLLDVPCGGGRHSLVLAARGYEMTGVDISSEFLDAARAQAQERALNVEWHEREMRDLPWTAGFDGAFCLGNSFAYLNDDENAAFLRGVAAALRPGARFILESGYVAESLFPALQERAWYPDGEKYILAQRQYDPMSARLHVTYTFINNGVASSHAMSARIYTCREIIALLRAAGFATVDVYQSHAKEAFRLGSPRLLAVAVRG